MVASTLAASGDVFTRDDDLELVGQGIPFGLKLYESLLDSAPRNKDLLIAACSNFTQYGVAYLETEALTLSESTHHDEKAKLNARALKMYIKKPVLEVTWATLPMLGILQWMGRVP